METNIDYINKGVAEELVGFWRLFTEQHEGYGHGALLFISLFGAILVSKES